MDDQIKSIKILNQFKFNLDNVYLDFIKDTREHSLSLKTTDEKQEFLNVTMQAAINIVLDKLFTIATLCGVEYDDFMNQLKLQRTREIYEEMLKAVRKDIEKDS